MLHDISISQDFLEFSPVVFGSSVLPSSLLLHALARGACYRPTCRVLELLLTRDTVHTALCAASWATGQLLYSATEDLNNRYLNCLFVAFYIPFQDAPWKLLINRHIVALKLVLLVWGGWHYQGEMLHWHRAALEASLKPFWCKMNGTARAHLTNLQKPCDDPHGVSESHCDFAGFRSPNVTS